MNRARTEALLRRHEGVKNTAYKDSKGIWTIGIGHNLNEPISDLAVSRIFQDDLDSVVAEIQRNFSWFDRLDEVRQAAIIDMVFNMGMPTFSTFRKTIRFIEQDNWYEASREILRGSRGGRSQYAIDVGPRADRISQMLETGEWL